MRKMVSLLLFLVMIMYTSSISFADENNDNIESIVESHSSEKNDVDINSSETDNVSIMDKNNKSDKVLNNTAVEDKENIVNNMTEDELEAYHVTLDQNEFSKIQVLSLIIRYILLEDRKTGSLYVQVKDF